MTTTIERLIEMSIFQETGFGRIICQCSRRSFYRRNAKRHMKCKTHMRYFSIEPPIPERHDEVILENESAMKDVFRDIIRFGNLELVKFMVEQFKCSIHEPLNSSHSPPPLILATKLEHIEIVKYFLSMGCWINITDSNNDTALSWACHFNSTSLVKLLVDKKANKSIRNKWGLNALECARKRKVSVEILDLLIQEEYELITQECSICYETKHRFWTCANCRNSHCSVCHLQMTTKCPFCRQVF